MTDSDTLSTSSYDICDNSDIPVQSFLALRECLRQQNDNSDSSDSLSSNEITNSLTFDNIPSNLLEHLDDFINTLPNNEIYGDCPHENTMFYIKQQHGL